eukprot:COSAG02_NODE_11129_length_1786_cov_2.634262_2_plen_75_part_00
MRLSESVASRGRVLHQGAPAAMHRLIVGTARRKSRSWSVTHHFLATLATPIPVTTTATKGEYSTRTIDSTDMLM